MWWAVIVLFTPIWCLLVAGLLIDRHPTSDERFDAFVDRLFPKGRP